MSTRIAPTWLVGTIVRIRNECRAAAPNATRTIPSSSRALLEKRRHMDRQTNHLEYAILSRLCRQRLAEPREFAAHSRRCLKMEKHALAEHRLSIPYLKAPDGSRCSSLPGMESIMANFYSALFKLGSGQTTAVLSLGEDVPPFLTSEVRHAVEAMPSCRLVLTDLQWNSTGLRTHAAHRASETVFTLPCEMRSSTTLLFKKGDKEDLENYRPITLLPVLCKVFTHCILTRIRRTLDEAELIEQARFRCKFSTLDHIITCCRLIEAAGGYQEPQVPTLIVYKKAFDSVEPAKVWKALEEQGIEMWYMKVLSECY
ncbi:hypothetical protein ANCDUO_24190 [Ancylostoma duodenale]|uniref:Uncharacterized protein n=1 Tax=Ancylostoma duodenale TaxID=51022 RepID=A0A0C2FGD1_9BILA|nr:hypothetical protein ANCDUO_24190 [Ancylostoma duodenale]